MKHAVLALDIDHTLCQLYEAFIPWYNIRHQQSKSFAELDREHIGSQLGLPPQRFQEELNIFSVTKLFENVPIYEGTYEALRQIARTTKLYAISARPLWIEPQTKRDIQRKFRGLITETYLSGHYLTEREKGTKKSAICQRIGATAIVEDSPTQTADCTQAGIHVYLFRQRWNHHIPQSDKVTPFTHWSQLPALLQE